MQKLHEANLERNKLDNDNHLQDNLLDSTHNRKAYHFVRRGFSPPLSALAKQDGATHHADVDSLLRDSWTSIYNGNSTDQAATIHHYLSKYLDFLFRPPILQVEPLTAADLFDTIAIAKNTAPGFDHWTYADLLGFFLKYPLARLPCSLIE